MSALPPDFSTGVMAEAGDLATGALFAGEALSAVVGVGGLIQSIAQNIKTPTWN